MTFGASLSIKQCRNFGIDDVAAIQAAHVDLGISRFRLMSYWNEHEKIQGTFNFSSLDRQIKTVQKLNGTVTLCLGVRQPRWPESHWPEWAQALPKQQRNKALLRFIQAVVKRYKANKTIVSWQLENEALLKSFGEQGDFDRTRLRKEFSLVKRLDPARPIIMTTSTSWGIPLRRPIPDIVGFSLYRITHNQGAYHVSIYQPWIFKLRALLIRLIWQRPSFIHELQAEPWGPKNIWEMSHWEQSKSMNPGILKQNMSAARKTGLGNADMWGLEWWYWLREQKKPTIWRTVQSTISYNKTHEEKASRT